MGILPTGRVLTPVDVLIHISNRVGEHPDNADYRVHRPEALSAFSLMVKTDQPRMVVLRAAGEHFPKRISATRCARADVCRRRFFEVQTMNVRTARRMSRPDGSRLAVERLERRRLLSATIPSFSPVVQSAVGATVTDLVLGNFDSSGHEGAALTLTNDTAIHFFGGDGQGHFTAGATLATLPAGTPGAFTMLATGDFNGDGLTDLAALIATNVDSSPTLLLELQTPDGSFAPAGSLLIDTIGKPVTNSNPIVVADLNGDGKLDVAVCGSNGTVATALGDGTGQLSAGPAIPPTFPLPGISLGTFLFSGDFTGDGHPDLMLVRSTGLTSPTHSFSEIDVLTNNGTGGFTAGAVYHTTGQFNTVYGLAAGNAIAGPGAPDLLLADDDGLHTLSNHGHGNFTESQPVVPLAGDGTGLLAADFTGEGGLVNAIATTSAGVFDIPTSSSTVASSAVTISTSPASLPVVGDLDGDGTLDLVTIGTSTNTIDARLVASTATAQATQVTLLTSNADPPEGVGITFTAILTGPVATQPPTGTVEFLDGTTSLGEVTANSGRAIFDATLAAGTHQISAMLHASGGFLDSTSAALTQLVGAIPPRGPQLSAKVVFNSLPSTIVAGEAGHLVVSLSNIGFSAASGLARGSVYVSTTPDPSGIIAVVLTSGSLARARIHLGIHGVTNLTATCIVPAGLPDEPLYLLGGFATTNEFSEEDLTDNFAVTGPYTVVTSFGTVGGRRGVSYSTTDADGTTGLFRLLGPGTGVVSASSDGVDVSLTGTTAASRFIFTATGGADGAFALRNVTAASALGMMLAPSTTVAGSLSLPGGVSLLRLLSLSGATASIGTRASSISIRSVDSSDMTIGGPVLSLSAGAWTGGSLTANSIQMLNCTAGFSPSLTLNGSGGPSVALVLGTLRAGTFSSSLIAHGSVGRIIATHLGLPSIAADGTLSLFSGGGDLQAGSVSAAATGRMLISGAISGSTVNVTSGSLGNFAAGALSGVVLNVKGNISALQVNGAADSVELAAANVGSLFIAGDVSQCHFLAGANFGPTTEPGGGDDTFTAGRISSIRLNGSVSGSTVFGAGVMPTSVPFTSFSVLPGGVIQLAQLKGLDDTSKILAETVRFVVVDGQRLRGDDPRLTP
jgi:hypothetical protein